MSLLLDAMTADDGRFYPKAEATQPEQVSRNDYHDGHEHEHEEEFTCRKRKKTSHCRQMAHTCTQLGRDQGLEGNSGRVTLSLKSLSRFPRSPPFPPRPEPFPPPSPDPESRTQPKGERGPPIYLTRRRGLGLFQRRARQPLQLCRVRRTGVGPVSPVSLLIRYGKEERHTSLSR